MLRVKPPMYSWRSLLFFSNLLKSDCTLSHLLTRASRLDWTSIAWFVKFNRLLSNILFVSSGLRRGLIARASPGG